MPPGYSFNMRSDGPQRGSCRFAIEKELSQVMVFEPRVLSCPTQPITMLTELSRIVLLLNKEMTEEETRIAAACFIVVSCLVCIVLSCLVCIVVSCLVCIVVFVLDLLL